MKKHFSNLFKYLLVGGSAALLNWAIFYVGLAFLQWHYLLAGLLSFVLATLWNFIFARLFIFSARNHSLLKESALVYAASFFGLLIDMGVLALCVEIFALPEMLAKILATGVAFVFNFAIRAFVIYKPEDSSST